MKSFYYFLVGITLLTFGFSGIANINTHLGLAPTYKPTPKKQEKLQVKKHKETNIHSKIKHFSLLTGEITTTDAFVLAPNITAVKSVLVQGGGNAIPGGQLNYSVILSNTASVGAGNDATSVVFTDVLNSNLTLINTAKATPIGVNDLYQAKGNIGITVGAVDGLLTNDVSPDNTILTVVPASGNGNGSNGGTFNIAANGSFTYINSPGFNGTDTFTYTINSANGMSNNATVTVNVSSTIWFVNAGVTSSGNGTLASPFKAVSNITGTSVGNIIFFYSGTYTGALTLLGTQKLIGQGATASFAAISGLTFNAIDNPIPSTGGTNPIWNSAALTLNSGNDIEGINFNSTTGTTITGASVGALKIRDVSLNNTAGQALQITAGGALDVQFKSISAIGSSKGISINSTTGNFQVLGTGTTAGSGGTISSMTTRGAEFISATNITLKNMNFTNANTSTSVCATPAVDNSSCNAAIHLKTVTGVTLDNLAITGTNNAMGININNVSGFSLANSIITGAGSANAGNGESSEVGGIYALNLAGTCFITNTQVNDSWGRGFFCYNGILSVNPTVNLTVTSSQFKNSFSRSNGGSNFIFQGYGTSNNTITLKSSDFSNSKSYGLQLNFGNTSNNTVQVGGINAADGNNMTAAVSIPGSNGFALQGVNSAIINYNVYNNTFQSSFNGVDIFNIGSQGNCTMQGRVNSNTATGVSTTNSNGIYVASYGSSTHKAEVLNNTISGVKNYGIGVESNDNNAASQTARVDATVKNNTISMIANSYAHVGVLAITNAASTSLKSCINVGNNTTNSPAGLAAGQFDVLSQNSGNQIIIQGSTAFIPVGGNQSTPLTTFWNANNVGTRTAVDEGGGGSIIAGTCLTPSNAASNAIIQAPKTLQAEQIVENSTNNSIIDSTQEENTVATNSIESSNSYNKIAAPLAVGTITINGAGTGFSLPAGKSTTITFSATISSTPSTCAIPNVASISGAGFTTFNSNTTITNLIVPSISASTISNTSVCSGGSINLTATCSAGSQLNWFTVPSGGGSASTASPFTPINITTPTSYYASCTIGNCESTRTLVGSVTVNPLPIPSPSSNSPVCAGNTLNLQSAASSVYSWTGPNSFTSTLQNPSITLVTTLAQGTYSINQTTSLGCTASATIAVLINASPTATASSSSATICAGAIINLIGGNTGNNYAWAGPLSFTSTNQSPSITNASTGATGIYTITVTNASNCTAKATTSVTVNAVPTATASSPLNICAGTNLTLTGGGIGTYAWTGANSFTSTVQSPTIISATTLATGIYTLTVTNANSCTSTATTSVTVNAIPLATASSNAPVIVGNTLMLSSSGGGTYLWSGPNTFTSTAQNPTINNVTLAATGTYLVTLTNAGCTATATTAVSIVTASASSNSPICQGNTLNLSSSGGENYAWTGPNSFSSTAQNPSITNATVSVNGVYTVVVTNGVNSVAVTTSVTVNALPTATASSNAPICAGNTLSLTGGGIGNYLWAGPNSYTSTVQNPTIAETTILETGIYTLKITGTGNCTSTATTSVIVNALSTATATPSTQTICSGGTITNIIITGTGTDYNWTRDNTINVTGIASIGSRDISGSLTNTTETAITVTFTITPTSNGCNGTAITATVVVNPSSTVTANSNSPICSGVNLNLIGGGIGTYAWAGPNGFASTAQSPTISNATALASGIYTITITNSNSCTSTATISVIVNALPTATASSNSPICIGNTLNLTTGGVGNESPSAYSWTGVNGFTSSNQNPSIPNVTILAAGTYKITVTDINGCTSTATTSIIVNTLPTATASSNSTICSGATLNLIGGGGTSYVWAGQSGYSSTAQNPSIANATISASGVYTLTVTNVNGCTSMATTSVTINPLVNPPTPQANTQIIFGASVTLTATGCSAVNNVLKWYKSLDNSLVTMPISPTITANYYANCETTLNAITCISANSIAVTVTVLSPDPPVTTGATTCIGTPITLTATGCTGSVGTFVLKWYRNSDNVLVTMPISPMVSTDYYAKCEQTFNEVTAISIKSNVVTLTVLNPPIPVSAGGTIYNSQSISLTATGCTGMLGTFTLRWYRTSDNSLVTMPVSPTLTTQYYSKCEQVASSATCLSPKSNDVTLTIVNRIFVDITRISAPIQNGNSWATAYGNLQTGLAVATPGVEVWVAKGTYKPTATLTRTIYFTIPNNVRVYGGFAGTEDNLSERDFRTNLSILSGDIGTLNLDTDNSYHVVVMDGSSSITVLDGFTIQGGYANFDPKRIYNLSTTAPVTSATIETGGGIVVQNAGSPLIANCTVINNAAVTGGGIYAGDASTPLIMFCKFMGNQAGFGSGIYFQDGSNGKVDNTLITGNKGIGSVYNNHSNPMITNTTFAGNGGYNGGIFNTISQPIIKNSIIWGNSTPFNDTQSMITYSIIQGGYSGIGNLSMNPQFINLIPEGLSPNITGDYHLKATSLAIDRGDNGAILLTDKDLDNNLRRFAGGSVDMGTYEFQGISTATLVISIATGNWESNSTWDIGRVPQLGDYVIIDNSHIITLNTTGVAKNLEYRGMGQLKLSTPSSKLEIGF